MNFIPIVHMTASAAQLLFAIEYTPLARLIRKCTAFKNNVTLERLAWYASRANINKASRAFLLPLLEFNPVNPLNVDFQKEFDDLEKKEEKLEEKKVEDKKDKEEGKVMIKDVESSDKEKEKEKDKDKDGKKDDKEKEADKKKKPEIVLKPIKYTRGFELESFIRLVSLLVLYKSEKLDKAQTVATDLIARINSLPIEERQVHFEILAKAFFFQYRIHFKKGGIAGVTQQRKFYFDALRAATLINDEQGMSTLTNIILETLLQEESYTEAAQFVVAVKFPNGCSASQQARYLFLTARIDALQGKHQQAEEALQLAANRAPKDALGFHSAVLKLLVTVQMLLGRVPKRTVFLSPNFEQALKPYMEVASALRSGNVAQFDETITARRAEFEKDNLYTMIHRLRLIVVQNGLRRLCHVYGALSFKDIATKLNLSSAEEAEAATSQAIGEGNIRARIVHEEGCMRLMDDEEIFSTTKPEEEMQRRITTCIDIHDRLVKSIRFARVRDWDEEDEELRKAREEQEREFGQLENTSADEGDDFGGEDDNGM